MPAVLNLPSLLPLTRAGLALGLLMVQGPALSAQDLQRTLVTQLGAAESTPTDQLFELGHQLLDSAPENTDTFRNALIAALEGQSEKARLAGAVALKALKPDATYAKDLLKLIEPLATSSDDGVRALSMALCADPASFQRFTLPESRFMIHQPSTAGQGTASDLDITAKEVMKLRARYNKIIADAAGKKPDDIVADAHRDFWLNATEAKQYGIVDRVIATRAELD